MIEGALKAAGGQKYLTEQANKNPVAFMNLVAKVLPMQVQGQGANGEILVQIVQYSSDS